VATPEKVSAGTIQVTGLAAPVEIDPNGISFDYSKTISDPFPGFETGAAIALAAAGDVIEPFSLNALGVSELASAVDTVSVARDSAVALTWDAPETDSPESEVFVSFTVNAHGSVTGWIECTVEDDGSFEIPAGIVTNLIDLGLSGFPRVTLSRRSAANTSVSTGCVDLRVESELTLELEVEGLVSCNTNDDCPEGTSCSAELACE
jgi:hypothetical protein